MLFWTCKTHYLKTVFCAVPIVSYSTTNFLHHIKTYFHTLRTLTFLTTCILKHTLQCVRTVVCVVNAVWSPIPGNICSEAQRRWVYYSPVMRVNDVLYCLYNRVSVQVVQRSWLLETSVYELCLYCSYHLSFYNILHVLHKDSCSYHVVIRTTFLIVLELTVQNYCIRTAFVLFISLLLFYSRLSY